jgi:hypothetical protein
MQQIIIDKNGLTINNSMMLQMIDDETWLMKIAMERNINGSKMQQMNDGETAINQTSMINQCSKIVDDEFIKFHTSCLKGHLPNFSLLARRYTVLNPKP